ncbi:glutathione S-transferase N-terminal domain-containing protein [uncultured Caulobacter sp.]|uniref:glutathione S-transferase N-terminal domain-containing protein n=1 Tax=uncultured Caulobacter sp. TaxID=158749 RepID=UPI0026110453|nr:glutathione S-transferase family protein [uncultured Caulobacter sp.]
MSEEASQPLALLGAAGSPYTRKMLSLLRFRRIPHAIHWGSHRNPPPGLPEPKVKLLPTFYFPTGGGLEAVTDSTPIIRRLEREHAGRSVIPDDPVVSFLNDLVEDYADEWLTKAMFHFRWAHAADIENAGPMLIFWHDPTTPSDFAELAAREISKRQIDRLYVVGSNPVTAPTIEASYARFVDILDAVIARQGFVLGARPSAADFAIQGQLSQLAIIEPTSAAITVQRSRRVRAWLDRVEDLSGLEPDAAGWASRADLAETLRPLLAEIGRVYAPFLRANAKAAMAQAPTVEAEIDGRPWTQPTFPYQAKCLAALRQTREALSSADQGALDALLADTGCEILFDPL